MSLKGTNPVQLLGGVFLGLALFRFLTGDGWIVWLILGLLFGGLGLFKGGKSGDGA